MKQKLCACGRSIYGISGSCPTCLEQRRAARAEVSQNADSPPKVTWVRGSDEGRHPEHLGWVRLMPCAAFSHSGRLCSRTIQAAHVRMNTGAGMGLKPHDRWTIPLCWAHHQEQHQLGHAAFDAKYGIDSRALAERLAAQSPHLD